MLKKSSRNQIRIQEVKDGILVLPGNKYRLIMESSAINFELKSDEEQDAITETFQHFLNALPCQIQVLVRVREVDIEGYVEGFLKDNNHETQKVYKDALKNYTQFIKKLVSGNKIMSRKFYIVIGLAKGKAKSDFAITKEQLLLNADIISKNLEKMGMKTRLLGNLEILDMFYSIYNSASAKHMPLTKELIDSLITKNYGI